MVTGHILLPAFFTIVVKRVQPQDSDNDACVLSCFSRVQLCVTPWTVARQAPLSMGFSRQEYWSGLPFPPPGDLPDPGIEPASLKLPALARGFFTTSTTWEAPLAEYPGIPLPLRRAFNPVHHAAV